MIITEVTRQLNSAVEDMASVRSRTVLKERWLSSVPKWAGEPLSALTCCAGVHLVAWCKPSFTEGAFKPRVRMIQLHSWLCQFTWHFHFGGQAQTRAESLYVPFNLSVFQTPYLWSGLNDPLLQTFPGCKQEWFFKLSWQFWLDLKKCYSGQHDFQNYRATGELTT